MQPVNLPPTNHRNNPAWLFVVLGIISAAAPTIVVVAAIAQHFS